MTAEGSAAIAREYSERLAEMRGPHEVGKPCPRQPWKIVTTLDWQKSVCGACGRKLYATA